MTNPAAVATRPDAPPPFVPLVMYMRCVENHCDHGHEDHDGGLLLLQGMRGQPPEIVGELIDGRLSMSMAHGAFMRRFPVSRDEKLNRYFRVTIEEVVYADLPPDPNAKPELFNAAGHRVDQHGNLLR